MLLVGEIGKPHGLGGEVYLVRISDDPRRFEPGSEMIRADGTSLVLERGRLHGERFLAKFRGVDTREDAERLRGPVYVRAEQLRRLDEGEFWHHDLVGCTVVGREDGEELGRVGRVVVGPAQDLLAVETASGERLVPLVSELVVEIDPAGKRLVIDPPAGLLD